MGFGMFWNLKLKFEVVDRFQLQISMNLSKSIGGFLAFENYFKVNGDFKWKFDEFWNVLELHFQIELNFGDFEFAGRVELEISMNSSKTIGKFLAFKNHFKLKFQSIFEW